MGEEAGVVVHVDAVYNERDLKRLHRTVRSRCRAWDDARGEPDAVREFHTVDVHTVRLDGRDVGHGVSSASTWVAT
jgi:hypothetical protein